jgi:DNA-binding winged helix-turn-helix (wHTH) protein/class 3 adenylate cyclase/tetratricopeptide (TPR) repeat protein
MQYVFGAYTLDVQRDELRDAAGVVRLDRQVFAVLAYLVQHHDQVVRRQELFEQLWSERFVSDAALERCIAVARRAVGDNGRSQQVIQTVHGRGYRFVALVEKRHDTPPGTAPPATLPAPDLPPASPSPLPAAASPAASIPSLPTPPSPLYPSLPAPRQHLPAGERRQVTVLCGTLAHTTALADRLGLAAFQHLVQRFHTLAQDCVQRYEGTVQTLGEEGVLALFGVPVAQEEHAWRAVQAALALQQRLRSAPARHETLPTETLTARMGVHTGWVVAGSHSDEVLRPSVVGGDTTQGAMHLQALADPGTLLVSDTTLRLLRSTVYSTAYGLVRVPGHTDPLMAYTVQGLEAPTGTRLWSPFVGRQRELAVFDDLLARALAGQGQVVGLIGEPGIGKSRLLVACGQRLPERPVTVLEGHCRAYNRFLPYGPVRDLLLHQCGLSTTSSPEVVAARVDQLLRAVDLPPEASAPYLLQLLGSPATVEILAQLTPEVIKERTFATLRQVHLRSSQQRPLLLVVENLHWIDPTSEAYLASLVEQLAGAPLLLLTTYRPGYRPLWLDKSYATQLTLSPLTPRESATIVRAVLPPAPHTELLVQRILARAAGNPLFLEELAHAMREQGSLAANTPVPETIQAVLAARIDRLPSEAKYLLQTAAVLGTEVPVSLLETIAELSGDVLHRNLAHLQAAEFLYETRLVPEQVYTFKHVLTQEVAYGSLLHEQRLGLHTRIVEALEALAGDQVAEQVDRLAYHALRSEVWAKALAYCRQAGERAMARSAHREATGHFEQALSTLRHLPETRDTREQAIDLRLALRSALFPSGDSERILATLREAEALDDPRRLGQASIFLSQHCYLMGTHDHAITFAQRARALATASGDLVLHALANLYLGVAYHFQGDYHRAIDCFKETVASLHGERGHQRFGQFFHPAVVARAWLAVCHAELGTFAEGRAFGEEGLRLAEAVAHPGSLVFASWGAGLSSLRQGALPRAIPLLERAVGICQDADLPATLPWMAPALGAAYTLGGRCADAVALLTQVLDQMTAMGIVVTQALCRLFLAEAHLRSGPPAGGTHSC